MPTRFVILHHVLESGEHWDLMLENDGVLLTWQLPADPTATDALPMAAKRIADHRLAYLDYEGPVSQNRGTVHRIDRGETEILELSSNYCRFTLVGSKVRGLLAIRAQGDRASTLDHA